MKFYKLDNYYHFSLKLLKIRFFYRSKKFSNFFNPAQKNNFIVRPIQNVSIKLTTKWSTKTNYYLWDFLRTVFYFYRNFGRKPITRLINSKYFESQIVFDDRDNFFRFFISQVVIYRRQFPKLATKNFLANNNNYIVHLRETQLRSSLPIGTIFDFYNWKNRVPVIFKPYHKNFRGQKFLTRFHRFYYVQLYFQLFNYNTFKTAIFVD